jgi:hypothetical protein
MNDYPYTILGADGRFYCIGLHRPGFPTLLRDMQHRFGYMGTPAYRGRPYHQFGHGCCKVHVNIPAHPSDPTKTAWFTTATMMTLITLWRGLPTRPSWSSVSTTYRPSMALPSPCSLIGTWATWCGVSVWPLLVTPSFRPTMRVVRSWHAMPST